MHEHRPSGEMHPLVQAKKTKVRLHFVAVNKAVNVTYVLYITNKKEHGPCCRYNAWA